MNRPKLLAMAALLAVPLVNACGDDVVPPVSTGSIKGQVTIEGQGIDGITVILSGGVTATTAGGGAYRFEDIEAGAHTITISNYPEDAYFAATSAAATLADGDGVVIVAFKGSWIRTSAITGAVTVENDGLKGVAMKLSGVSDSETQSGADGKYAFSGLRAGSFTIEISGFHNESVTFESTSSSAAVAVGESKVVNFEGTYLRTSAITVQVSVEDSPLEGVSVRLQGKGEDRTETTDSAGQYMVEDLRSGDYSIGISGYDTDEYGFVATSKSVTVAPNQTAKVEFGGTMLRTAGIMGRVSVAGSGLGGVTVTLAGKEERNGATSEDGRFSVSGLAAGDYTLSISGYDEDEYHFDASQEITLALGESRTVNFMGRSLRTAAVIGAVSAEGEGLAGVSVTLIRVLGASSDETVDSTVTGSDGGYRLDSLLAGTYRVEIAGFDDEYDFEATSWTGTVAADQTVTADFKASRIAATQQRVLFLWGGVDAHGVPHLDPSFVLDGAPFLPRSGGPHQITGRDADGADLFLLRFEMPQMADGDGSSSFVFFLRARQEWADRLVSITLSGPGGSFTLDRNSDHPMAILLNPKTGQIRQFVRDLPKGAAGREAAERLAADTGSVLAFSRGIPEPTDWRR